VPDASFQQMTKTALAEDIVAQILALLREKQLRPGDKLPPERILAATMHVSRPSLREALRTLSIIGVLDLRHGSGAYITTLEPAQLVQHLDFVFALDDSTYLQLFETRKVIEPAICQLAAQRITDTELAQLDACVVNAQEGLKISHELYFQADFDLHETIAAACGNFLLQRFMQSIHSLGMASRQRTSVLPGIATQTLQDHQLIVQALKRHHPEDAYKAMLSHLEHIEQRLVDEQKESSRKPL